MRGEGEGEGEQRPEIHHERVWSLFLETPRDPRAQTSWEEPIDE